MKGRAEHEQVAKLTARGQRATPTKSAAPGIAESDSYSVSSARATPTLSAAPGTAESDSYNVSSAVESLGRSNEHFDQHE